MAEQGKRKSPRIKAAYQVFTSLEGKTIKGITRDVSPYGIGVLVDAPFEPGQELEVRLFVPEYHLKIEAKGKVIYCIDNPDQAGSSAKLLVGIQFTEGPLEDLNKIDAKKRRSRHTPAHTITINTDAKSCYKLLGEFSRYPEWASGIESAKVLSNHPDGRGQRVEFVHNFFLRKVRYVLDYFYDDENLILSWVSAGGDDEILTISGSYTFKAQAPHVTSAAYELYITLSIIPSRHLVQYVTNILMLKEMRNFKAFVEKNIGGK